MATADLDVSRQTQSRATTSRIGSSLSSRGGSSFILHPFGFDSKTSYDATDALINTRSASFVLKSPPTDDDIWKRPPPDFRPQCYEPRPPMRNSRDAMQPWRYGTIPGVNNKPIARQSAPMRLPDLLMNKPQQEPDNFVTAFNIPGPWEAKVLCAKVGVFKPEQYRMPKPHDFRGYPKIQTLGLPEFMTDNEHDPYNIKFISDRLDILPGDGPTRREEREIKGIQMAPPLPGQLHWDRQLILDQLPFPNKYPAYTRFRRKDRSPHSALMERVEDRLDTDWAKRQLDRQLQQHRVKRRPGEHPVGHHGDLHIATPEEEEDGTLDAPAADDESSSPSPSGIR